MCQITSNPYSDVRAIKLADDDFRTGSLRVESYARPGKLFTANTDLVVSEVGGLRKESFDRVLDAVVRLLRTSVD